MNKIFVTGPTGTQGFPIVKELLAKGFQIRAFALESDPKLPQLKELGPNVEVVCGDLLDEESIYSAVQGCDGVFFLPAIPTSGDPTKEITLGKNMVSACERANVTYMVHSSVDRAGEEETFKGLGAGFLARVRRLLARQVHSAPDGQGQQDPPLGDPEAGLHDGLLRATQGVGHVSPAEAGNRRLRQNTGDMGELHVRRRHGEAGGGGLLQF